MYADIGDLTIQISEARRRSSPISFPSFSCLFAESDHKALAFDIHLPDYDLKPTDIPSSPLPYTLSSLIAPWGRSGALVVMMEGISREYLDKYFYEGGLLFINRSHKAGPRTLLLRWYPKFDDRVQICVPTVSEREFKELSQQ